MGQEAQNAHFPVGPKPLRLWAAGAEVDIAFQQERVRKGCFCQGLTTNKAGKVIEYNMCPPADACISKLQCDIFRTQVKLGLPIEDLACMGAKDPREDDEFEMDDDVEAFSDLDDIIVQQLLNGSYIEEGGEDDYGDE